MNLHYARAAVDGASIERDARLPGTPSDPELFRPAWPLLPGRVHPHRLEATMSGPAPLSPNSIRNSHQVDVTATESTASSPPPSKPGATEAPGDIVVSYDEASTSVRPDWKGRADRLLDQRFNAHDPEDLHRLRTLAGELSRELETLRRQPPDPETQARLGNVAEQLVQALRHLVTHTEKRAADLERKGYPELAEGVRARGQDTLGELVAVGKQLLELSQIPPDSDEIPPPMPPPIERWVRDFLADPSLENARRVR